MLSMTTLWETLVRHLQQWKATLWRWFTNVVGFVLAKDNRFYRTIHDKDIIHFCNSTLCSGRGPQTIQALKSSLQNTPNCSSIYHVIQNNADFDVELVSNWIVQKATTVQEEQTTIKKQLVSVLEDLKHIQHLKERIRQQQTTSFDYNNPFHEETLIKLWNLLIGSSSQESYSRKSEAWTKLGFQGKDPATDFRGGGFLALQQLVYLAEKRRDLALQMVKEAKSSYPFACVGIRCTVAIMQLLDEEYLDTFLYGCSEEQAFEMIHERYCELWIRFHHSWRNKKWSDIMWFPTCFEQQLHKAKQSIQRNGYITVQDD